MSDNMNMNMTDNMNMTTPGVEAWFAQLPLTDPRCNNDSCNAYLTAHTASQDEVSWESQFAYGHYVAWIYSGIIAVFAAKHAMATFFPNAHMGKLAAAVRSVSYRRVASIPWLPTFGIISLLLLMLVASLAMTFAQYPYYRQFSGFGAPPIAVRTGLMAYALVPLEVGLAGKANLVTWLTGYGHEKLNVLHRAVGWLLLLLSLVHTIPFLLQAGNEGTLTEQFYASDSMQITGTPPLGMLVGLTFLSLRPLRRAAYELFVKLHVSLAIVFFALLFWHAMDLEDSWAYLWATLLIWAASLAVRGFGKSSLLGIRERHWFRGCPATVTDLHGGMVRLDVRAPPGWRWAPGQHMFLRFASIRPWQNHPFTVANSSNSNNANNSGGNMVFYIRPHRGITKALSQSGKSTLRVFLDGPYGTAAPTAGLDAVVLVAGGGGISGVLPLMDHLARAPGSVKSVTLIWVVRARSCIGWVEEQLQGLKADKAVKLDLWVTNAGDVERESTGDEKAGLRGDVKLGRPDLAQVVATAVGPGRTLVLGCGPESLRIDLSNAVAGLQTRVLKGEATEIKLHTECFGW